ncbi:MAG: branched-chain amino acid ABC transporter permease [Actinomycetota bacterium]
MTLFLQQLSNGTVLGALYGLIALGYTMVYGIISLINFAHGEIFMIGGFAGLTMYKYVLPDSFQRKAAIALPLVLIFGMLCSIIVALLVERFAYRPLRAAPRLAPLITAIGVSIALQELIRLNYPGAKAPVPFPRLISRGAIHPGGITIAYVSIFIVVVAIALMVLLQGFISGSRTGRAMRATAQDPDTARLMGIDTDRIIVTTFVIGAALAAVAGVMQGMRVGTVDHLMGFTAGVKAFTAAVLGGIGNIQGAVLGGFVLGIVESMATNYMPHGSAYKDVWAFVVLIMVLVFRPNGLLGERVASRS